MIHIWLQDDVDKNKYVLFELLCHVGWLITSLVNTYSFGIVTVGGLYDWRPIKIIPNFSNFARQCQANVMNLPKNRYIGLCKNFLPLNISLLVTY